MPVRGTVRVWHGQWGVLDATETPGGCWVEAGEILDAEGTPELLPGEYVDFEWQDLSASPQHVLMYRARNVRAVDFETERDDEDRDLLDREEPVIDGDPPHTIEDMVCDSLEGQDPAATLQPVGGHAVTFRDDRAGDDNDLNALIRTSVQAEELAEAEWVAQGFAPITHIPGADQLLAYDADLMRRIIEMDEPTQRKAARWCAIRAYEYAGLADREWVAPALTALSSDQPPPAPFEDIQHVSARWQTDRENDKDEPIRPFHELRGPFDHGGGSLPYHAIPAYFSALDPNPLAAVIRTLSHASHTYGADVDRLHAAFKDEY